MKTFLGTAVVTAFLAAPLVAQADGPTTVEIPLRMEGGRLIVPVSAPDGTQLEFILSTGSTRTALSASAKERLGDRAELSLRGVPVPTAGAATLDDSKLTVHGRAFDGMISANTLSRFDVLFDVPGGRLVLKQPGKSVAWDGVELSDPIPVRIYHGAVIGFDVELNGRPYQGMLEVGSGVLVVNQPVMTEASIEMNRAKTLVLGEKTFENLIVEMQDLPVFRMFSPDGSGFVIVGSPIAVDCVVAISYVHQELRTCAP